ncbi:MAG: ATP-binding protein [Treponema sp.]|nr:putative DNA binding domain-containing protein [Spirochaetia bacterium]MDD7459961.1 ATP-binding protein [Spirochaetales bacterium]MDY5811580.1 ATP-binding protein [Treponema sp.]
MLTDMTIEEMCSTTERQQFDRKSAKIDAAALAIPLIAFANSDGGLLAIGIEDNGEITGIDDFPQKINELLRAGYDFCQPSIFIEKEIIDCTDRNGNPNHILLIKVPQSSDVHVNNRDESYIRVGDKSKKLNFEERMELMYSKGIRFYEDEPVYKSSLEDIDLDFVAEYCKKIGYKKSPKNYIEQNKDYVVKVAGRKELSGAAVLMFGKEPQRFFPRSRVRFIRYEGTEAKVGTQMNVIKDVVFEGRILELTEKTIEYVKTQIKEHTYLGKDGRFVTESEYPEFAWKELIVNAITHRDYSIKGTDIQIKMFDDHITVESPGTLPGTVRLNNMREIHYSRNPKIAMFLHEYEYVREFGEGIDRMYREMEEAGLPEPEYKTVSFMVQATIKNKMYRAEHNSNVPKPQNEALDDALDDALESRLLNILESNPSIKQTELAKQLNTSRATIQRAIEILVKQGNIIRINGKRFGYWKIIKT